MSGADGGLWGASEVTTAPRRTRRSPASKEREAAPAARHFSGMRSLWRPTIPSSHVPEPSPGRRRAPQRQPSILREAAAVIATALVLSFLLKTFLIQTFYIPSESMEPALEIGDRIVVSQLAPGPLDVHRGDIVVFKDTEGWMTRSEAPQRTPLARFGTAVLTFFGLMPQDPGEHLVKRVIGVGGDHVACCDAKGRVSVNGKPLDETYVYSGNAPSETEFDVVVPEGKLWVMGDHRANSGDSRYNQDKPDKGFVSLDNVVGVAMAVTWPIDRAGLLRNPGEVFEGVPDP